MMQSKTLLGALCVSVLCVTSAGRVAKVVEI